MLFLHFYSSFRLKYLFAFILVSPLFACSTEDAGTSNAGTSNSGALNLAWVAPSERADNTGLSLSEIAGYRIYYGTETGNYQNQFEVDDAYADQAQIEDVPSGAYYLVMTTVDTDGRESPYSSEVVVII